MPARSFTVHSNNTISFVVGTGTKAGQIQIKTPGGTATSVKRFEIVGKAR